MQTITTRYKGATNYRGARMVAVASGGRRVSVPYPHELSGDDCHREALYALAVKLGWHGPMIAGHNKDGSMTWVFISDYSPKAILL